jgi:hypothetical protein
VGHCVGLGGHQVAGRFAFPAVLLDLRPLLAGSPRGSLPLALDRVRGCACAPSVRRSISALMAFSSPSEHSRLRWNSSRLPKKSEFRLSWDSPHLPLCRFHRPRPLREACASVGSGLRGPGSWSALVVSHHLGGLLRVRVAGLLHPASGSGVRRVSGRPPVPCGAGWEPSVPGAAVTLRRVPLASSWFASLRPSASLPLPSVLPVRPPGPSLRRGAGGRDCRWPSRVQGACKQGRGARCGGSLPKEGASGAGSRRPAEAVLLESRRLPPRGPPKRGARWGSPLGAGRSRSRLGARRSGFQGGPGRSQGQEVTGDGVTPQPKLRGTSGAGCGVRRSGPRPVAVGGAVARPRTSQAKATRGFSEETPEPKDRLPGPR